MAEFIHIEVWRDFNASELNEAAAGWIQTEEGCNEPWLFFVGADGTIQARWDNVLGEAELVEILDGLPVELVDAPAACEPTVMTEAAVVALIAPADVASTGRCEHVLR